MRFSRRSFLIGAAALAGAAGTGRTDAAAAAETISFESLYKTFGVMGLEFTDTVVRLKGREVLIQGYMAPPLKAESDFFVLTREPLAICPFCSSDADWPLDIAVVYLKGMSPLVRAGARLSVTGRLDLGSYTDPATGFVSQVRLVDAGFAAT